MEFANLKRFLETLCTTTLIIIIVIHSVKLEYFF